jgi:hypothetical protein
MSKFWADIMDEEDKNVSVHPEFPIERRLSIRPRRTQGHGDVSGVPSVGTGSNNVSNTEWITDTQNFHKSTNN